MSAELLATIQAVVRHELARRCPAELAVVQEQHPHAADSDRDNYACTVVLRGSGLVLRRVPVATGRVGAAAIPAVGELVLVQFLGGDLNRPVITGSLYDDEDRPPANADGQLVLHLPSGAGEDEAVRLVLSTAERRELSIALGGGLSLALRDDDPAVELEVDGGAAKLTIARDGGIKLESRGNIAIEGAEVSVTATGKLTLDGASIAIG